MRNAARKAFDNSQAEAMDERLDMQFLVARSLAYLTPIELYVLRHRYWGDLTLQEIGDTLSCPPDKVARVERSCFRRLREVARGKGAFRPCDEEVARFLSASSFQDVMHGLTADRLRNERARIARIERQEQRAEEERREREERRKRRERKEDGSNGIIAKERSRRAESLKKLNAGMMIAGGNFGRFISATSNESTICVEVSFRAECWIEIIHVERYQWPKGARLLNLLVRNEPLEHWSESLCFPEIVQLISYHAPILRPGDELTFVVQLPPMSVFTVHFFGYFLRCEE